MKKLLSFILALCFVVPCVFVLSGCGFKTNVKYVYSGVKLNWASELEKQEILGDQYGISDDQIKQKIKTCQMYFYFKDDGTVEFAVFGLDVEPTDQDIIDAFYTKEDNQIKVYIDEAKTEDSLLTTLTINGKALFMEERFNSQQTSTYQLVFTKQ
jgi:hypothetical protein